MQDHERTNGEAKNDEQPDELPRYELSAWQKQSDDNKLGPHSAHSAPKRLIEHAYADLIDHVADSSRALTAHTGWLTASVAKRVLRLIPCYNAFRGNLVAKALDDMPEDAYFAFGREDSPVLYVSTHHSEDAEGVLRDLYTEEPANPHLLSGGVRLERRSVAPDELWHADSRTYPRMDTDGAERSLVRAWWD